MATTERQKHDLIGGSYDNVATGYKNAWLEEIPHVKLENELTRIALGDCTGYRVLDLAGGSGGHATQAIEAGAKLIDLVDISQGMLDVGKQTEEEAGRNIIQWHLADIIPPLADQLPSLPQQGYDIVMAMWPFDHTSSLQELEGMWANVAAYLKPGGKLVAVRMAHPWAESAVTGKYGSKFFDIERIPDGIKLKYVIFTDPPFALEASSMESSYSGSNELPEKYGLTDVQILDMRETETVRSDPEFWEMMSKDPHWVVFTARKK